MEELDVKKTKYFVIAIIILIILGIILIVHFNNKEVVSGDVDNETTTTSTTTMTTTTITTTTKKIKVNNAKNEEKTDEEVIVEELDKEEVIYKSTIDEKNNLVYNYKLTDEIGNNDRIISTKLNVDSELLVKNVIALYDISLDDEFMNKKTVINSLINIKIPIKDELVGYDEYKVVYINESNEITEEKFEVKVVDNYIEFNTNHLSIFGIIGIKNVVDIPEDKVDEPSIDLSEVDVILSINDKEYSGDINNTVLLSKSDKLNVKVLNIDYEYELYYSLSDSEIDDYKLFNENILNEIDSVNTYNLKIKIVVKDESVVFDLGKVSIYDIVYVNDGEVTEEVVGTIYNEDNTIYKNEDGTDYLYDNEEINKDIVIDNGDNIIIENKDEEVIEDNNINNENSDINEIITNNESDKEITNENNNDINEDDVKIKVNGNIYLVEETDISKLEMTGYLIIDTSENITFDKYEDKILLSNLYTITIRSKEFSLNGIKYTYEYDVNNNLIIKRIEEVIVDENTQNNEIDVTDEFENLFDDVTVNTNENNELVIEKNKEEVVIEEIITK